LRGQVDRRRNLLSQVCFSFMLSKPTIEELRVIFREEFGRDLTFAQASSIAKDMVGFWDTLAKIKHKNSRNKKIYEQHSPTQST